MKRNILTSVVVFVVLCSAAALLFYKTRGVGEAVVPVVDTQRSATTSDMVDLGGGVSVSGLGGGKIEQIPNTAPTQPSLAHTVSYSADLPTDVLSILKTNIASTTHALTLKPSDGQQWLRLGLYYKMAGDYKAAENIWVYLTKVMPTSIVPHHNLADLYQNFLHDYASAEVEYKKVIQLDPANIETYRNLFTMYSGQYRVGTSAAKDIISQGLKANPNNPDLLEMNKQLQKR